MGNATELGRMTAEEFLEWDRTQTIRHEFVDGEVYAMSGAGIAHNLAAGNLYLSLRGHLAGSSCRTFQTDVKLKVEAVGNFYFPDLIVTCSPADASDLYIVREPTLLVEVLSPSTQRLRPRGQVRGLPPAAHFEGVPARRSGGAALRPLPQEC